MMTCALMIRKCPLSGSIAVGLGGAIAADQECHAQTKVYGHSLAMVDDWERRVTQMGRTKTVHEHTVYQLQKDGLHVVISCPLT